MKKLCLLVSLVLSLSLIGTSIPSNAIENLVISDEVKPIDNKVYAKVSMDQNFADDCVLVV